MNARKTVTWTFLGLAGLGGQAVLADDSDGLGEGWLFDATGYYIMTDVGADAAFGTITPITGTGLDSNSHAIDQTLTDLDGFGLRLSGRRGVGSSWFAVATYSGFFTDDRSQIGSLSDDSDLVHNNLLDRSLADEASLNGDFDDGEVDFASDDLDLDQHFVDFVVGRQSALDKPLSGFWQVGLRATLTDLDREVVYGNLEGVDDLDTATIDFESDMWGIGPTAGGGITAQVFPGLALTGAANLSALYADFDLTRRDSYFNFTQDDTAIRLLSVDTQHIVPVFDASLGLESQFGPFTAGLGYTLSAWLGGARSLSISGWDDVDDDVSPFVIRRDNLVTHGIYARLGMNFGAWDVRDRAAFSGNAPATGIFDIRGYYLMSNLGGDPAIGLAAPITGSDIDDESFSGQFELPEMTGGGLRLSAKGLYGSGWFGGAQYTGFFVDERESVGSAADDTDLVLANLVDRSLADDAGLNGDFDDNFVDFASDDISLDQHFGDLVIGRRSPGTGPISGHWLAGLRIASTDVERDVIYQNLEGVDDLDVANINMRSDMWGVGPTAGGGVSIGFLPGLSLSGAASVSALYADFDVSRRDAYFDFTGDETEIRHVSLDVQDIVPVFDASVDLSGRFGQFELGIGYTASAWLGGARSLRIPGGDDVDADTSVYYVRSDTLLTHGVFARLGMRFGETAAPASESIFGSGPDEIALAAAGYYLMTDFGGDPAFAAAAPIIGTGIDDDSFAAAPELDSLKGGGLRLSAKAHLDPVWFVGGHYTGFFSDEDSAIGTTSADNNNIFINLPDRGLADEAGLSTPIDDGLADFASDDIEMNQHFGDLVVGRRVNGDGRVQSHWRAGLRVANTGLKRHVLYVDRESDGGLDTVNIDLDSDMLGIGPVIGGGVEAALLDNLGLSGSVSAAAVYADFDLSRNEAQFNNDVDDTEIRRVQLDTQDIVPVFDASVALSTQWGPVEASVGYTVSAWLDGARSLAVAGWDDIDEEGTPYTLRNEDLITHGAFLRLGVKFGAKD